MVQTPGSRFYLVSLATVGLLGGVNWEQILPVSVYCSIMTRSIFSFENDRHRPLLDIFGQFWNTYLFFSSFCSPVWYSIHWNVSSGLLCCRHLRRPDFTRSQSSQSLWPFASTYHSPQSCTTIMQIFKRSCKIPQSCIALSMCKWVCATGNWTTGLFF